MKPIKILSLDSTALVATVAVTEDEKLLAQYDANNGNTHSETLLPMIERMLSSLSLTVNDIDVFACSAGPGSFTGVRIGSATIKGLAFGSGKPCIGVSTLEALAFNMRDTDGIICPVMNARRDQLYCAVFKAEKGTIERLTPDMAISVSEFDEMLSSYSCPIYAVGDGYEYAVRGFVKTKLSETPKEKRNQSAYSVAMSALKLYKAGDRTSDKDVAPTYLRLSQAERERNERLARSATPKI